MAVTLALLLLLAPLYAAAQFNASGGVVHHGRATNYGPTDQFNSDWSTGSCKCWGPDNYDKKRPCFDRIDWPAHVAAVNTNNLDFTETCGTCLAVSCIPGPTRGFSWSQYSYPGCKPGGPTVFVQVTDSCPCSQNQSNEKWCCNNTATITRHLDLSSPAFSVIADKDCGVIDVLFQEVPCPDNSVLAGQNGSGAVWATWEKYAGTTIQEFSTSRPFNGDTLSHVESESCASAEAAVVQEVDDVGTIKPTDETGNRTGELPVAKGKYSARGTASATGFI